MFDQRGDLAKIAMDRSRRKGRHRTSRRRVRSGREVVRSTGCRLRWRAEEFDRRDNSIDCDDNLANSVTKCSTVTTNGRIAPTISPTSPRTVPSSRQLDRLFRRSRQLRDQVFHHRGERIDRSVVLASVATNVSIVETNGSISQTISPTSRRSVPSSRRADRSPRTSRERRDDESDRRDKENDRFELFADDATTRAIMETTSAIASNFSRTTRRRERSSRQSSECHDGVVGRRQILSDGATNRPIVSASWRRPRRRALTPHRGDRSPRRIERRRDEETKGRAIPVNYGTNGSLNASRTSIAPDIARVGMNQHLLRHIEHGYTNLEVALPGAVFNRPNLIRFRVR